MHDHDEKNRQEQQRTTASQNAAESPSHEPNEQEETSRRDFIKKSGKAGLASGLVTFMLVGGTVKDAFAEPDDCVSPYDSNEGGDECSSRGTNPDLCPSGRASADSCTSAADPDICNADMLAGDSCEAPWTYDPDICSDAGIAYDECETNPVSGQSDDVCSAGDTE